ncbi:MAG: tRNA (adenosine(37)-N6)-threonylcarbamoyltransferase complex dimerization subunit type 1 TsaB [Acidobacteria bacterium]|nr:MAG: tRNA (adenosine(37)-N6)-threonylcarbamoyltransferase complex dimerization subunit type 1 TsaB [Acidobacteriota bacterium]
MRVLALDTTRDAGSVAVIENDRVLVELAGDTALSCAARLPGDVLRALNAATMRISDIDLFAVAAGPGPFTALRIGIATVQGLAFVNGKRVVPVSTLEATAYGALRSTGAGMIGVWLDAHRGEVYSALYRRGGDQRLIELEAPAVATAEATWLRWSGREERPALLAGDGAVLYRDVAGRVEIDPPSRLAPLVGQLALLRAEAGAAVDPAGVQPLYVRRPDAEIARDARSGGRRG